MRNRSPKARQLASTPTVEIAWWLAATQHQFRLLGRAYVLASPSFSSRTDSQPFPFPSAHLAPYADFSWEDERIRQFRKMSPELRASFCRPVPGTTVAAWGGKLEDLPVTLPEGVDQAENDEQKKQLEQGACAPFSHSVALSSMLQRADALAAARSSRELCARRHRLHRGGPVRLVLSSLSLPLSCSN